MSDEKPQAHEEKKGATFKTGLFGIGDDTNVVGDVLLCFPCQISRQCNAIEGRADQLDIQMTVITAVLFFVTMMAPMVINARLRQLVVHKYQLEETPHMSILLGFFCFPCSLCQTNRELTLRGTTPGGTLFPPKLTAQDMK